MTNDQMEWGPDEGAMTWHEAGAFAKAKGEGWRLPTIAELGGQFDYDAGAPRDPSWKRDWFWSSSVYSGLTTYAWVVTFYDGYTYYNAVSSTARVRCVRSDGGGEL
jgi:hypothetical protein